MNKKLLKLCEIRDKLYKKWAKNKTNEQYETIYKKFNNSLNKKINFARNAYNFRQFVKNRKNIRVTWQLIGKITGKKIENIDKTIMKNFSSDNAKEISDNFAIKFNANVQNLLHNCTIKTLPEIYTRTTNSMFMNNATEHEIYSILKTLNARKSAGVDEIRSIDLKNNAQSLAPVITTIINSSLHESLIPQLLKTSIIRPIYKCGTKSEYNNYRPISILSAVEKVLEEIVARRLNDFLFKYGILHKQQFGFQKGKNINQLLGLFSNHINEQLDKNHHCLGLFIDFSKAFDTLPHNKLVEVLENIGIRGKCIEWFKYYLDSRHIK